MALKVEAFLHQVDSERGFPMLRWAITFAIIALIAGVLGFSGLEATSASIARFLALVFVILFVAALVVGRGMTGGPTV